MCENNDDCFFLRSRKIKRHVKDTVERGRAPIRENLASRLPRRKETDVKYFCEYDVAQIRKNSERSTRSMYTTPSWFREVY